MRNWILLLGLTTGCAGAEMDGSQSEARSDIKPGMSQFLFGDSGQSVGSACAAGCIWSACALTVGAQSATHLCEGRECVCIEDGNVYTQCDVPVGSPDAEEAGSSVSHDSTATAGSTCGAGCIWSTYAVSVGAQSATHGCNGRECACVRDGDVWTVCPTSAASTSPPSPRPEPTGRHDSAATHLLNFHESGRITLWNQTFGRNDGADPLNNMRAAARGENARRSCYGTAPCGGVPLDGRLLRGMEALVREYGFSYFVTCLNGASHSYGSLLYSGRAIDIDEVCGGWCRSGNF